MNSKIAKFFDKTFDKGELIKTICFTFFIGLIAHGYCFFNSNLSHDSLLCIIKNDHEFMIAIGRFFRPIYTAIRGENTLPLINGLLSLLFLSIVSYLIIKIFNITNKYFKFAICGILTTNFSASLLYATYIHDADAYMFALLLAVFSVVCYLYNRKLTIISIIMNVISLGLYQTYIQVGIFIYLALAILELINGKDIKEVFKSLIQQMLIIVVSMALYFLTYNSIVQLCEISKVVDGNSVGNEQLFSIASLKNGFICLIQSELRWFKNPRRYNKYISIIVNIAVFVDCILCLTKNIKIRKLNKKNVIFIILLLLALPIGINIITFIYDSYHDLTIYPLFFLYVFALIIIQDTINISGMTLTINYGKIVIIAMSLLIIDNCFYSNKLYVKKDLENKATISLFTRILDRIEQTEGYELGETKIAFVGTLNESNLSIEMDGFDYDAIGINNSLAITSYDKIAKFVEYYLGYPAKIVDKKEAEKYGMISEVYVMPAFPNKESIKIIDDVLIVKLS